MKNIVAAASSLHDAFSAASNFSDSKLQKNILVAAQNRLACVVGFGEGVCYIGRVPLAQATDPTMGELDPGAFIKALKPLKTTEIRLSFQGAQQATLSYGRGTATMPLTGEGAWDPSYSALLKAKYEIAFDRKMFKDALYNVLWVVKGSIHPYVRFRFDGEHLTIIGTDRMIVASHRLKAKSGSFSFDVLVPYDVANNFYKSLSGNTVRFGSLDGALVAELDNANMMFSVAKDDDFPDTESLIAEVKSMELAEQRAVFTMESKTMAERIDVMTQFAPDALTRIRFEGLNNQMFVRARDTENIMEAGELLVERYEGDPVNVMLQPAVLSKLLKTMKKGPVTVLFYGQIAALFERSGEDLTYTYVVKPVIKR